jgi:hypothetical protein
MGIKINHAVPTAEIATQPKRTKRVIHDQVQVFGVTPCTQSSQGRPIYDIVGVRHEGRAYNKRY